MELRRITVPLVVWFLGDGQATVADDLLFSRPPEETSRRRRSAA
ncbi:hypothetical protein [Nonomuraea terrae]|nr:hypothetical protein [Nonomuraea terrae]